MASPHRQYSEGQIVVEMQGLQRQVGTILRIEAAFGFERHGVEVQSHMTDHKTVGHT